MVSVTWDPRAIHPASSKKQATMHAPRWVRVPDPTALANALATSFAPIEYASTKAQTKAQAIRPWYKPGTPTSGLLYLALTATAAANRMETGRRIRLQTMVPRRQGHPDRNNSRGTTLA